MKKHFMLLSLTFSALLLAQPACAVRETSQNLTSPVISPVGGASTDNAPPADTYEPIVKLRDNTLTWPGDKPGGGWWVTPIHAVLLPSGKVLLVGWIRRDELDCADGGTRRNGTTFIVDPDSLRGGTLEITPLDEKPEQPGDTIYCAGNTLLGDGRVFFPGGSRYGNGMEEGLNYARLYDPVSGEISRVNGYMSGGPPGASGVRWYPTGMRLPDGRALTVGGLTRCCEEGLNNRTIEVFDPSVDEAVGLPWNTLVSHEAAPPAIEIDSIDYPKALLLPAPLPAARGGGLDRQVAIVGSAGRVLLLNVDDSAFGPDRFFEAPNSQRPVDSGLGVTTALTSTGELLLLGHRENPVAAAQLDLYDPLGDRWRSFDTGIGRYHSASVLLPDGKVLLINGATDTGFQGDTRTPQIMDPAGALSIVDGSPPPDDEFTREYHSFALLLKDGRVLVGGGTWVHGGIGCERPDLRIYNPPYFAGGMRPVIVGIHEPVEATIAGPKLSIGYTSEPPRPGSGVVLMALGAFTHGFDQNQRYVRLDFDDDGNGHVSVTPPQNTNIAPPGDYILYFVSNTGVPSIGKHLHLATR